MRGSVSWVNRHWVLKEHATETSGKMVCVPDASTTPPKRTTYTLVHAPHTTRSQPRIIRKIETKSAKIDRRNISTFPLLNEKYFREILLNHPRSKCFSAQSFMNVESGEMVP